MRTSHVLWRNNKIGYILNLTTFNHRLKKKKTTQKKKHVFHATHFFQYGFWNSWTRIKAQIETAQMKGTNENGGGRGIKC